jgi:hypothetical protein
MIINVSTKEFSKLSTRGRKKVFAEFFGHPVNEIVSGSMTNGKWGEFRVRHEEYAYSNIKIEPTEDGLIHMTIWNYQTEKWQEEAE